MMFSGVKGGDGLDIEPKQQKEQEKGKSGNATHTGRPKGGRLRTLKPGQTAPRPNIREALGSL